MTDKQAGADAPDTTTAEKPDVAGSGRQEDIHPRRRG